MLKKYAIITGLAFFIAGLAALYGGDDDSLFGPVDPFSYVTGQFDPAKHPAFTKLDSLKIPCKGTHHIMRKEAAEALKRLYDDFRKEHPRAPFWVQSSTRNFEAQKTIWQNKWKAGGAEPKTVAGAMKRGLAILTYSSMPGTSRHHWGTEVDLNVLRNDYFEKGQGAILFEWLVRNAPAYGFCRPYTAGRDKGYAEEKWHWSYRPLSSRFLEEWNVQYEANTNFFSRTGLFRGSAVLGVLAPDFVNAIGGDCR